MAQIVANFIDAYSTLGIQVFIRSSRYGWTRMTCKGKHRVRPRVVDLPSKVRPDVRLADAPLVQITNTTRRDAGGDRKAKGQS
ncbi:Hypothetical protein NTJ_10541 [Nesidiocoris tenuis]|uniref:Uncharacterized protein n=1 Tax=Nesidiocoris tenuis TaxID=355587 RepID=A0ABN7B280_9HEMI|nr:Hypothetical protein NTJ_10541 [Nesidiocoris tenuis]